MTDEKKNCTDFTTDWEKIYDFWNMTKREFLESYSYLTEEEYDITCNITIGCRICDHEVPKRITEDDFIEAISVQLENFKTARLKMSNKALYDSAYDIAKHEAIADFFTGNLEVNDYIPRLAPYLDGLLNDFCEYEGKCDKTLWTDWDELLNLVESYIKNKEIEKE